MRRSAALVICALTLLVSSAARAEGVNNLLAGVNGIATFPADPVTYAVDPPEDFSGLPGAVVTAHVMGFMAGTVMATYRLTMGVFDIAFFPFWVFPTLSPEPRFKMFKDVEYE